MKSATNDLAILQFNWCLLIENFQNSSTQYTVYANDRHMWLGVLPSLLVCPSVCGKKKMAKTIKVEFKQMQNSKKEDVEIIWRALNIPLSQQLCRVPSISGYITISITIEVKGKVMETCCEHSRKKTNVTVAKFHQWFIKTNCNQYNLRSYMNCGDCRRWYTL